MLTLPLLLASQAVEPGCHCRAPDPCIASVPFHNLNATVGGRLVVVQDEMESCLTGDIKSCQSALNRTDNEFFYTGQVGGYLHTGLAGSWNIAHKLASFAVAAEAETDIQAGVAFAVKHNLRLSVKGTGHDWFGRSGSHPDLAGSLMLWTHNRKNIVFHDDGFVAAGCAASSSVPAVTVQSGVQFVDLYPKAEARGRFVNAGTCTSVGVGGCTLGGCFGSFSQKLGPSASNVLQAKVVLANGTLITASKCRYPDLFWALRGGGAGFGVVTEWTMRTYRSPEFLTDVRYSGVIGSDKREDMQAVAVEVLRTLDQVERNTQQPS
jgi:FAD/FMN-containing dehydrogenase